MKLALNNNYTLLMIMLNPAKKLSLKAELIDAAIKNTIPWEELLYQANIQMCTPLWYAQLKSDDLLNYLPDDLVLYLAEIYQANKFRNQQLQTALVDLLTEFNSQSIDSLLLKGAATFCDHLFTHSGSRFMGDLDILVGDDKLEACVQILQDLGYKKLPNQNIEADNLATNVRHHQLPRYILPGTPVAVEIHFKISYGLAGRIISAESAWKNCRETSIMGQKTFVLSADNKLLLNTVHALLPYREFINGQVSLIHLSEFVLLAQHYTDSIDWKNWFKNAHQYTLTNEFKAYLGLAVHFMGLSLDNTSYNKTQFPFSKRILFIGAYNATLTKDKLSFYSKIEYSAYRLYYFAKLPAWMWKNLCYARGWKNLPVRIYFCFKKMLSSYSWSKL